MSTQPILPPDMESKEKRNHRHNYIANLIDGGFFGFAMGFASFTTVIPLFVSSMTSSAVLIGLIPAIHSVGWQFPQLLTARRVARLIRLKPAVLFLTIQERLPFLGLAIVAWFLPDLGKNTVLVLTFLFLIWQGLGSGFTANAWQNLIVRIIPGDERGTFLGLQSAAANLLASLGAFLAGLMLDQFPYPMDFSICFLAAVGCYVLSWFALSQVRELADPGNARESLPEDGLWNQVSSILKRDRRFRGYLVTRMLSQFAMMSFAFYTVYAVRFHHMNEVQAGILTSVLLLTQVIANPVLGRLSDRISKKMVLEIGAFAALLSSLIAWIAPQVGWFYLVIILSGIANTAYWTIGMAYTLEFGSDQERPTYIGLANTLIAPSTILAPIVGGWLADLSGYPATFISSAAIALITVLVFQFFVTEPAQVQASIYTIEAGNIQALPENRHE